jgi:putative ABC transport system permease protein
LDSTLDVEFGRRQYDILVSFSELQRVDRICNVAETVGGVEHAGMWLIAPASILHNGQRSLDAGVGSELQGIPIDDPMYTPQIVDGRWLQPGDAHVVVMNKQTADDENIHVGDAITLDLGPLGKDDWRVVGLYQTFLFFGGGFSVDAIYAPRQAVFEATKKAGRATTLLVQTQEHGAESVEAVSRSLEDALNANNIEFDQVVRMPVERNTSEVSFSYVTGMLMVLAVIVALVGGIGLMGSMWIGVIERTKEIGILRAVGAVSPIITRMFVLEGIVQGFMSWLIAVPVSLLLTPLMANALGQVLFKGRLHTSFNLQATFMWLAIVLIISVLASLIPARTAAGINVRQSLSYE